MTLAFELPDLGEGVAEGEVVAWHVDVGDVVAERDVLAEVETDKTVVEVPAPVAGRVLERHAAVGEVLETGAVLVTIDEDDTEGSEDAESAPSATENSDADTDTGADAHTFAPPSVRRLARERGVDIATVRGSGPGGRITAEDVGDAPTAEDGSEEPSVTSAVRRVGQGEDEPGVKSAVRRVNPDEDRSDDDEGGVKSAVARVGDAEAGAEPTEGADEPAPDPDRSAASPAAPDAAGDRREPYEGRRRAIGERLTRAWREVPHGVQHDRVAGDGLVDARERLAPLAAERDVTLSATPIVVKCVAAALAEHPIVNTHFDAAAEAVVYREGIHVAVATATEEGLVQALLRNADERGVIDLARALAEGSAEAAIEEPDRATFTVGAAGGEYATPIVRAPQTATLATGALEERPVVSGGEVRTGPTLPLSLSVDRRVIDGADAGRFLGTLGHFLADPARVLVR